MAAPLIPQVELLSSAKLRVTERLLQRQPEPDAVVLRAAGGDRRLVVTPAQADILTQGFAGYKTVPEALVWAIAENRCPPLREFYELVVQAHAAGILVADPAPTAEPRTIQWPVRIPPQPVVVVAGTVVVASAVVLALALPRWGGPGGWIDVVVGWLAACALLSLGQVLAVCVIAGSGEARAARLFWLTRFPHFQIDTGEAIVGGRTCEVAVAAIRAAPPLVGAAVAAWKMPGMLAAVCGSALYVLAPFGNSAARQWLASRRRAPGYSVRADFLFEPTREDLWVRWRARGQAFYAEFGWLGLAWLVVWLAWTTEATLRCMPKTTSVIVAWIQGRSQPLQLGAEYLLLGAIGLGLLVSAWAGVKHWWLQRAWAQPLGGAQGREPARPPLAGDRAAMLAQVALFRDLDDDSRAALAAAMEPVECGRGEAAIREDEPGDDFYLMVAGEAEVRKRRPHQRRAGTIGWLGPGDCFGEIALLEHTVRSATIVATRPTRLLKLGRPQFERLVVGRVGAARIRQLLQHARFLGRLTFTAGWSFTELVAFAQRGQSRRFDAQAAVVREGEPNHWFYLIFDGTFEARQGERVLRRMGPGDYFGEISLLEGWAATATVVTVEEGRCLALSRADFLALFARDFRIGLRMEALAERRLGARVFASR